MRNPFASSLWRNPSFVRVWTAASISIFGSLITRLAIPFAAILVLGSGAIEVALLRGAELVAALIFGLVAGAWVDRLRRRPVLIWADLAHGGVDVGFADPPAAGQAAERLAQPVAEGVEHGPGGTPSGGGPDRRRPSRVVREF